MNTTRFHVKNVASLLLSGAASKIIVFLATIQIIKGLSVPDNGVYQVAYSLAFIYSIFAELGVRGYLLREISKVRDDSYAGQRVFSDTFYLRLGLAALILPASVAINVALGYNTPVVVFGLWLTVYAVLDTFAVLLKFLLRAYDRTSFDPIFTTVGRGILLVSVLLLAHANKLTLERVAVLHVASAVFELAALVSVVKLVLPLRFFARVSWEGAVHVFRASIPFAVGNLAAFIYLKSGLIVLSLIQGEDAAAYFGTAGRIPEAALFLPAALANAFIPFFSRNAKDIPLIRRYFSGLIQCAAFAGAALAAAFIFETDFIIRLVSKAEYLVARPTFRLYGAWMFLSFIQLVISNLLICLNEERALMWRYVIALIANLLLNAALIPVMGITGAAIALVLSELGAAVYNYMLLKKRMIILPRTLLPESALIFLLFGAASLFPAIPAAARVIGATMVAAATAVLFLHYHYPEFLKKLIPR